MEYQPLLLRRFDSTGNITSNPLERLITGKTQAPLCQVSGKQSSSPNTRRTMNDDMLSCLCIGNGVLDCLFQVIFGWNPKIRNRQLQHLESLFEVQRSQIAACPVETLFVARQENNDPDLFLMKLVIDLAMEIIGSEWHRTPKDTTGETKGQFSQRH
jgi:hypothetical protein